MESWYRRAIGLAVVVVLAAGNAARGQGADDSAGTVLSVYLDCRVCDFDFLRRAVTFVDFVRDRKQADVHVLVSSRETGGGGTEFAVEFIGRGRFAGLRDTLLFVTPEAASDDEIRRGLAGRMKIGLMRFVGRTPGAENVAIEYRKPVRTTPQEDRWNYWTFTIQVNAWMNGQKAYRSINTWGSVEARRVTEEAKVWFELWGSYNENKFSYEDQITLSITRSKGAETGYIWSLGDHWSAGAMVSVSASTFSNLDLRTWASAAMEYNIFPYRESSRRQCRFIYRTSFGYADYQEVTIYDRTTEWLAREQLAVEVELIQPWGSVRTSAWGSHYFHDFRRNRLQVNGRVSLRLVEGLSLNIDGSASRVRDQLSLRRGDATQEEVLLRRRELETSYEYWVSVGFSYTFGSIYSNIVNPRFGD